MLIKLTNTINSIVRKGLSVIRNGLKMWLPFEKSEILGEELVVNGDFATDSDWDETGTWSIESNYATSNADGITQYLGQDVGIVNGRTYKITYTVLSNSLSQDRLLMSGTSSFASIQIPSSIGQNTVYLIASQTPSSGYDVRFANSATNTSGIITLDNISVKEVTQIAPDKSNNSNSAKLFTGKALSFDGVNDYVDFGSDVNNDGTVWTTAIWIGDYTAGSSHVWIYGDDGSRNIGLRYGNSNGRVFYRSYDATYNEFSCDVFNSDFTNAKRLVFTSDGTDISLYIDGELIDTITPTTTYLKLSRLMAGYNTTSYMVAATVSDFQLYDTAWTQDDVTFDYNNPQHLVTDNSASSIALSNLKGYWHLSESDGAINYDSSGEDNDGTISGATWEDQQATIPQLGLMDWSKGSNMITYSEDFSDSSWTKNFITVTTNSIASPDGVISADLIESTSTASCYIAATYPTLIATNTYTFSVFAKKGNNDWIRMAHISSPVNASWFDLENGVIGTINGISATIEDYGNGWYRCTTTFVAYETSGNLAFIGICDGDNSTTAAGSGQNDYIWGAQLEEGSSATAYRRTNGTAVTDATLIADPNNPSEDILGNSVRLREHSLNLDGIGYAEVPDADNLDFGTGDFSIEMWVKTNGTGVSGTLISKYSSSVGFRLRSSPSGAGEWYFQVNDGISADTYRYCPTSFYNAGWCKITAVVDRSKDKIDVYFNDSLDNGVAGSENLGDLGSINNSVPILLLQDTTTVDGLIDDVRIYNRALSSDEVEQNYKAGLNKHKASSSFSDDFSSDYGF